MNLKHLKSISGYICVRSYTVAAQRSAQPKKFAAFVVDFFIPFPSGTKISGEYIVGTSGGKPGESRRFSSAVKILVLTPNPVLAFGGPPSYGARGSENRPPRNRRKVVRCATSALRWWPGEGGYASCGKKVRRALRSRKNMVHSVVAAQRP